VTEILKKMKTEDKRHSQVAKSS